MHAGRECEVRSFSWGMHEIIAFSSSVLRGELRFARAPRSTSTHPRVLWRLGAAHRVVKSCVLALRARPRSLRSQGTAFERTESFNPAFSRFALARGELRSRASRSPAGNCVLALRARPRGTAFSSSVLRGELRFARAPRSTSTRPRSLRSQGTAFERTEICRRQIEIVPDLSAFQILRRDPAPHPSLRAEFQPARWAVARVALDRVYTLKTERFRL